MRRIKTLSISEELFLQLLREKFGSTNIPKDAAITSIDHDNTIGAIYFNIVSKTFPEIQEYASPLKTTLIKE